ncbi:MAG: hypothetical protein IKC08_05995 [Lentisphaeria bacterium]|nr:hypothetical protein [Lentisphaeria bacterium]
MEKNLLSIGWASADISTEGPINLPGQFHMRISTGILDPITATALWISDGNDDVCFLSIDLVTCRGGLTDAIKEEVAKRNGDIPVEKILLNVTHTHSGPGFHKDNVTGADGTLEGDVPIPTSIEIMDGLEYRKFMVDKIASAVCEAWEKRSHGAIAYGYGYAVVAHSRRVLYMDDVSKRPGAVNNSTHGVNGHAVMYGNTADSKFSGYEGGADHFTNLLFTFDEKKKLTGVLVNVPCPSQNSEGIYKLSASFWNETREAIRKKFGNIFILPQAAAGGDLAPRQLHYRSAESRRYALKYGRERELFAEEFRRRDIAERIAASVEEVYSWAKKDLIKAAPIHHEVLDLKLSKRLISKADYDLSVSRLEEANKRSFIKEEEGVDPQLTLKENCLLLSERNRCKGVIKRWNEQNESTKYATQAHVLSIGDIAFASNQFELYIDFQHRIQARSPFIQTFIVQLAGVSGEGGGSYLATKRGFLNRGYSASMYCNLVSWKGGNELVEKTLKSLNKLWTKEHK